MNTFPGMQRLPAELAISRIRGLSTPELQGFLSRLRALKPTEDTEVVILETCFAVEREIVSRLKKGGESAPICQRCNKEPAYWIVETVWSNPEDAPADKPAPFPLCLDCNAMPKRAPQGAGYEWKRVDGTPIDA